MTCSLNIEYWLSHNMMFIIPIIQLWCIPVSQEQAHPCAYKYNTCTKTCTTIRSIFTIVSTLCHCQRWPHKRVRVISLVLRFGRFALWCHKMWIVMSFNKIILCSQSKHFRQIINKLTLDTCKIKICEEFVNHLQSLMMRSWTQMKQKAARLFH